MPLFVTKLDLSDMVDAKVEYIYCQNLDGTPDMIEIGTIQSVKELPSGKLEIYVVPDNPVRMAKYRIAEKHIVRYVHAPTVIENAAAS